MNPEIKQLNDRITRLEALISGREYSSDMSEKIRDIIIFDVDNLTATTQTASANLSTGDVTIGKIPTTFGRVYLRGKVYNVALYQIS